MAQTLCSPPPQCVRKRGLSRGLSRLFRGGGCPGPPDHCERVWIRLTLEGPPSPKVSLLAPLSHVVPLRPYANRAFRAFRTSGSGMDQAPM